MHVSRTRRPPAVIHEYQRGALSGLAHSFTTAVSLHAHTWYSREPLTFIPRYALRIPIVGRCVERDLARYRRRAGKVIDFSRAFWRPPLAPFLVFRSEVDQIRSKLGLDALVSLTDHDSIKAGQVLRSSREDPRAPVSLEWTVPFGETVFHLGVHNLPASQANAIIRELSAFTTGDRAPTLAPLLEWIAGCPGVLVILNHPLWDLAEVGDARHRAALMAFLSAHRDRIHAVEINGYRTSAENRLAITLAGQSGLPAISGGDRHGRTPNAVLNLTRASTFAEFAHEIREDKRSDVLLMPACRESLPLRKLQTAADILRDDPEHPYGGNRWTERIFYRDGGPIRPLCDHWAGGAPRWLQMLVRSVTGIPCRPLVHASRVIHRPLPGVPDDARSPVDVDTCEP